MTTIHINSFVRRQTAESGYSHWTITDEELLARIQANLPKAKPGYRDGVVLVPVPPQGFYTSTVVLQDGDHFVGEYVARRPGEEPRKSTYVATNKFGEKLEKVEAKSVNIVLYSHNVLMLNHENESSADYEIISINAEPTDEEAPIPTGALIANHFELSGGTATNLTDSEFVALLRKSVLYWKDKSLVSPKHLVHTAETPDKVLGPDVTDRYEQIKEFVYGTVANIEEELKQLKTKIGDVRRPTLTITQPADDQQRIMFLSGQLSLALFLKGATS